MEFQHETVFGTIQKRYKRFLSDITLDSGEEIVAHVANTGAMAMCWEPGWKVLLTHVDDPKRKLQYSLQMTHNGNTWIGINTSLTNKLVKEALATDTISELIGYESHKPEQKILDSRLDFFLSENPDKEDCYLEVKNVTLVNETDHSKGLFPDAVTVRGQKHLKDLIKIKEMGHRAVMLYICQREDIKTFSPAKEIDPTYAELATEAKKVGVEFLCYGCSLTDSSIIITKKIPVVL